MALEGRRHRRSRAVREYRQNRFKGIKIAATVVLILALCAAVGLFLLPKWLPGFDPLGVNPTEPTVPTEPKPDQVIHITAGGDVNVTDKTVAAGLKEGGYDYTEVFRDVLPVLAAGDVTVLNFEGTFGGASYGSATRTPPPELLKGLATAGVDILQTANSYSIFGGLDGLRSTISAIQGAGMTPVGTFVDKEAFEQSGGYLIWDIKGIKVAFVAFTKGMRNDKEESMGIPSNGENCINLLYEDYTTTYQTVAKEQITNIVRNAKAHEPDLIVALLHWGGEYNDKINTSQDKICKLLQEEGVDAIIGTHSHYVQKVDYDPQAGTLVAYSLGDFIGDAEKANTNYSVILDLEITKSGATGETKITGYDCVPIFVDQNESGGMRVLRMREAIEGYENRYVGSISEDIYNSMKSALDRINDRTGLKKAE